MLALPSTDRQWECSPHLRFLFTPPSWSSGAVTRLRCVCLLGRSCERGGASFFPPSCPFLKAFYYLLHFFTFFFQFLKLFKQLKRLSSVAVEAIVLPAVIRCLCSISKCKLRQCVKAVSMSVLNKCFVQILLEWFFMVSECVGQTGTKKPATHFSFFPPYWTSKQRFYWCVHLPFVNFLYLPLH